MTKLTQCVKCDYDRQNCGHYSPEDETDCPHYTHDGILMTEKKRFYFLTKTMFVLYALIAGFVSCILFSLFWLLFTYLLHVKWIFLGVIAGLVVGSSVRLVCKKKMTPIALIAGFWGLASCVLGDYLTNVVFITENESLSFIDTLSSINYVYFFEIAFADFDSYSLIVYFTATVVAYCVCYYRE